MFLLGAMPKGETMSGVNKVTLIGNLGADPEMHTTKAGGGKCNLRLATNEVYFDKDGNKQERVEWHRVIVFGKQAAPCAEYLRKGSQAYVEGRIQTREYEDNGQKKYMTEIIAQDVKFLGGGKDKDAGKIPF